MSDIPEKVFESEQEWRRFLVQEQKELRKEITELRSDLNIFKIKAFGLISALVAIAEGVKRFFP